MSKRRILSFVDHYTPGYKAGGPIRSISNMVKILGDNRFIFLIVTRNHDLNSSLTYDIVKSNTWQKVGKAIVFYTKVDLIFIFRIYRIIKHSKPDIIYFNSFFSKFFTILILLILRFFVFKNIKIIIAPRGEFSAGALKFKKKLKNLYLIIFRQFIYHSSMYFQASSEYERSDILKQKFELDRILIAPNLINCNVLNRNNLKINNSGYLKVIFFSRISPMKNLLFLVNILSEIEDVIEFEICGPVEDNSYWQKCLKAIKLFPPNIRFKYTSSIEHKLVPNYLSSFDVLLLPTLGENFGNVIIESLSAGLPVIISDNTIWRTSNTLALTEINLDEKICWRNTIKLWASMSPNDLLKAKYMALEYATNYFNNSQAKEQNIALFSI